MSNKTEPTENSKQSNSQHTTTPPEAQPSPQPPTATEQTTLASGQYRYYKDPNDINCQPSKGWQCIPLEEFMKLCKAAASFTEYGAGTMINRDTGGRDKDADYLLKNDGIASIAFKWKEGSKDPGESCIAEMVVEGMYEGSQVKRKYTKYAVTLLVTEEKKVLVHSTGHIYN